MANTRISSAEIANNLQDIGYKNNTKSNKIQTWQIRKNNILLGYLVILNPNLEDISNIFLVCSISDNYTGFNHNLSR